MKKITYIILFISFAFSLQGYSQNPNYRNVFWLHGVQGDVHSMKALSDYFDAKYKINSYYPSYISNRGINIAAQQLHGMAIGNNSSDIVVAHSLGG